MSINQFYTCPVIIWSINCLVLRLACISHETMKYCILANTVYWASPALIINVTGSLWQHEIKSILFYCRGTSLWSVCSSLSLMAWNRMHDDVRADRPAAARSHNKHDGRDNAEFSSPCVEKLACLSLLHCYWSPDFLIHFHIIGSTDLISQKRGWVITCHFNNVFYCLQALVVPSESNGGLNAKWNREGGIERRRQRMCKENQHWVKLWEWLYSTFLLVFAVSYSGCC